MILASFDKFDKFASNFEFRICQSLVASGLAPYKFSYNYIAWILPLRPPGIRENAGTRDQQGGHPPGRAVDLRDPQRAARARRRSAERGCIFARPQPGRTTVREIVFLGRLG